MEQTYEGFLKKLDGIYLSRRTLMFIYVSLLKATENTFQKTYVAMRKAFSQEISESRLIDPGLCAIPKRIAFAYLKAIGVDEKAVRSKAQAYFNA